MNIKEKLIEQVKALEKAQDMAFSCGDCSVAASISMKILDYIKYANENEEHKDRDEEDICPNCEEAQMKLMLHQDIANACDMPIEVVSRVLAGQEAVFADLD